MDSDRDDGNAIYIIGGDDKPVLGIGNEYERPAGGGTFGYSFVRDVMASDRSKAIQKMLFRTKLCVGFRAGTCQNTTNCNFAHSIEELRSLQQNYEEFGPSDEHGDFLAKLRESFQNPPNKENNDDRSYKHCKKFHSEEGCPKGDRCTHVHDEESKNRERTAIVLGGRSRLISMNGRGPAALTPVAPPQVLASLPPWPQAAGLTTSPLAPQPPVVACPRAAVPTPPLAPQPLSATEPYATGKPLNWKTRICKKWEYSGYCPYGSKCIFAHGEAELRRFGGGPVIQEANLNNQGFEVPNTVAAPSSSVALTGGSAQLPGAGQKPVQTWKLPKKINGIYGDWIDDLE